MRRICVWAALSAIAMMVARAESATPKDDWTGYYAMARGKNLAGFKPINPDLDKVIIAHLQPWARAKMEATDGVADDTGGVCLPDGIFRFILNGGTFLWLPGSKQITMVFGQINTAGVQRIHLDRPHPKNLLPTWNGDSVGHWEGDTLVVDTIGFNSKSWVQSSMEPHTEEAHMIQRIRHITNENGSFIEIVWTVEDRQALTSAYTYSRYYRKVADSLAENVCADDVQVWKDFRNKALKPQLDRAREVH
jgi:hypothetical protein